MLYRPLSKPPHCTPSLSGIYGAAVFPQAPAPAPRTAVCTQTPVRQGSLVLTRHGPRPSTASVSPATPRGQCHHPPRPPNHGEGQPLVQGHMASKGPGEVQNRFLWMPKATSSVTGDSVTKQGRVRGGGVTRESGRGQLWRKGLRPHPICPVGILASVGVSAVPAPDIWNSAGHPPGPPTGLIQQQEWHPVAEAPGMDRKDTTATGSLSGAGCHLAAEELPKHTCVNTCERREH